MIPRSPHEIVRGAAGVEMAICDVWPEENPARHVPDELM